MIQLYHLPEMISSLIYPNLSFQKNRVRDFSIFLLILESTKLKMHLNDTEQGKEPLLAVLELINHHTFESRLSHHRNNKKILHCNLYCQFFRLMDLI